MTSTIDHPFQECRCIDRATTEVVRAVLHFFEPRVLWLLHYAHYRMTAPVVDLS